MGADLYIRNLFAENQAKYEPRFYQSALERDQLLRIHNNLKHPRVVTAQKTVNKAFRQLYSKGYFGDNYTVGNMLSTLGLSWWTDLSPLLVNKKFLRGNNLCKFRDMVQNAEQCLPDKSFIIKNGGCVTDSGKESLKQWHSHYIRKRKELIDFLNTAIRLKQSIHCSL
jgi:hypothetical protein